MLPAQLHRHANCNGRRLNSDSLPTRRLRNRSARRERQQRCSITGARALGWTRSRAYSGHQSVRTDRPHLAGSCTHRCALLGPRGMLDARTAAAQPHEFTDQINPTLLFSAGRPLSPLCIIERHKDLGYIYICIYPDPGALSLAPAVSRASRRHGREGG
jgi:hypothetical protein